MKTFEDELVSLVKEGNSENERDRVDEIMKNHGEEIIAGCKLTDWIFLAARYCNYKLIKFFVDSQCNFDVEDSSTGLTPLLIAAMNAESNYCAALQVLFEAQVVIAAKKFFGRSYEIGNEFSFYWFTDKQTILIVVREVVSKLRERGESIERIGVILGRFICDAKLIVGFENRRLTKAYMQSTGPRSLAGNGRETLRIVIKSADLRHLKVILSNLRDQSEETPNFFKLLLQYLPQHHKSKAGRAFIKGVQRLDIFNKTLGGRERLKLQLSLIHASEASLRVFLKYNFHLQIKAKCGIDVLPCLYGNRDVSVATLLKNEDIDVNACGAYAQTPLHFAAKYQAAINITFLLDRGAELHVLDECQQTPLARALFTSDYSIKIPDESCVKLLLLAGAKPVLLYQQLREDNIYGIDYNRSCGQGYKLMGLIKLLTAQLAIYEAEGTSIHMQLKSFCHFSQTHGRQGEQLARYFEKCRRQLKLMKIQKIRDTRQFYDNKFTMFALLCGEQADKFARYINDRDRLKISKYMKKYRKKTKVSYYHEKLKKQIENINLINQCRWKAASVISECSAINNVHHLIINKIINYLTKELLMFKEHN